MEQDCDDQETTMEKSIADIREFYEKMG